MRVFYEQDAEPQALNGTRLRLSAMMAPRGRAQAQNLRDSGVNPIIGNIDDSYKETAAQDGFSPVP